MLIDNPGNRQYCTSDLRNETGLFRKKMTEALALRATLSFGTITCYLMSTSGANDSHIQNKERGRYTSAQLWQTENGRRRYSAAYRLLSSAINFFGFFAGRFVV